MLRILLVIAVALAVIIGLMRLTGNRSADVAPAVEEAATATEEAVDDTADTAGAVVETPGEAIDAAEEAVDAAGETVEDTLDEAAGENPDAGATEETTPPSN